MKLAPNFDERVDIISNHYSLLVSKYKGSLKHVDVVTDVLANEEEANFTTPVEQLAASHQISMRTLQRYFELATGISCKQALQVMRIRKALTAFIEEPAKFNLHDFGYFDRSHFYKHASQFLQGHKDAALTSPRQLLDGSGIIDY